MEVAWTGIRKDALGKYPTIDASKFHHLPNGFDSADFPTVDLAQRTDNRFTLTYTGSMYGRRNPDAFLRAVERLASRGEIDPERIRLRFIGRFGEEVLESFRTSSVAASIEVVGYMPHHDSIEQLFLSDALLLVVDECDESDEVVPGKVYEYIGSGRPLIAVAPERSAIADLIAETRTGYVAHQSNLAGIAGAFLTLYNDHEDGTRSLEPNLEAIARYERRTTTRELAGLLDGLTLTST